MNIRLPHKSWIWAILGGIAYVLCFPQYDLPALSILFLPALIFSIHHSQSRRQAWLLGFLLSAMVAIGGFHWIVYVAMNFGQMPLPLALGLLLLYCLVAAPQMVAFFVIGHRVRFSMEQLPLVLRPLFWAALYTSLEYLARFLKIFPEHLGNTLLAFPSLAQSASLGGVSLLSFLPLFFGATLAYIRKESSKAWLSFGTATLLIIALHFWGQKELQYFAALPKEKFHVGIVQHNMEEIEKLAQYGGNRAAIEHMVHRLLERTITLANSEPKPDLILWPETSYPILFFAEGKSLGPVADGYANLVKDTVAALRVPLLFGAYDQYQGKDFNAGILLGSKGKVESVYRKNVLLVFGEYFPMGEWFPALKTLNPMMGDFGRGVGPENLPFSFKNQPLPLGVNICYEAILPEYMRGYAKNGARLFVNLTKDSWFGNTFEPWQHLQLSVLRSIEHRIPMVRATNTGLSAAVSVTGATEILSPPYEEAAKTLTVDLMKSKPTLYTRWGEWFAWLNLLLVVIFLGMRSRRRRAAK